MKLHVTSNFFATKYINASITYKIFYFSVLWANSSYLMLPPKRSLRSWIILSNGEASKLEEEEDEEKEEDIFFYDKLDNRSET